MNIEDDILIERFLRDLLSDQEQQDVLKRIASDADFRAKVDFERELLESLDDHDWHFIEDYDKEQVDEYTSILKTKEFIDLKAELKRVNAQHKDVNEKVKQINWKRILTSSAAVLAIMFSVYLFTNNNASPEQLYNEYLNISNLPSLVSRDSSNNTLAKAQLLFEETKYNDALELLNKEIVNEENSQGSLLIYKGVSEMQLSKFNEAEFTFDALIKSNFLDAEKGYWYKALMYLKQDNAEMAKPILKNIVLKGLFNKDYAEVVLGQLD